MTEEANDGWGKDVQDCLYDVFFKLDRLMYEVRNCVRGGYTRCKTESELAEHLRSLASELEAAEDEIE